MAQSFASSLPQEQGRTADILQQSGIPSDIPAHGASDREITGFRKTSFYVEIGVRTRHELYNPTGVGQALLQL